MKSYKYLMVSSAKVGHEKTATWAKRIIRDMAGVGEVEGNSKLKTRQELLLHGKEAENSSAGKLIVM